MNVLMNQQQVQQQQQPVNEAMPNMQGMKLPYRGPMGPLGDQFPPNALQHQQVQQQQLQQQQQQQLQQQQQQAQQAGESLNNISKIKSLMGPLRESLSTTIKTAAQTLNQNSQVDAGSQKGVDQQIPRFDKNLEEFYSICDQIELHLKTSIKCLSQHASSYRYFNIPVLPTRIDMTNLNETGLTYPQFLATANLQVAYTKEIHDTLVAAAQNISPSD